MKQFDVHSRELRPSIWIACLNDVVCVWHSTGCGYIKVDDLRRIVNNLGHALSLRTVKELCLNVAGAPASVGGRARVDTRVYYRDITDKEVPEAV